MGAPSRKFQRAIAIIDERGAISPNELTIAMGCSRQIVDRYIRKARFAKLIYVSGYEPCLARANRWVKQYSIGDLPDAIKPRIHPLPHHKKNKPVSMSEAVKTAIQRRRDALMGRAPIEEVRIFRDPLVVALYGEYQGRAA